ncbi:MAG TPA: helix-turn-helix domain-containing protein [Pseudonocardiaceae bacterium]|nr:helix-turn-helix domain-containing protein [Pseudonocardiaceae bacterium]
MTSCQADAQRDYERLLLAAREIFGERGADVPLDDVARRAGIGNATMCRHFPTRRDLIIAVYADEAATLCPPDEALLGDDSPIDADMRAAHGRRRRRRSSRCV